MTDRIEDLKSAIVADDLASVQAIIEAAPELLHQPLNRNWGPPLSFAANLGRLDLMEWLAARGARDFQHAFVRSTLQGRLETACWLLEHGATVEPGIVMGACETLNADGLGFLLRLGADLADSQGDSLAPIALILQTYSRDPESKHRCLQLAERSGRRLPDTPMMAFHRGDINRLQGFRDQDATLLGRRFTLAEIYPSALGCGAPETGHGLHGTPLDGTTLLHLAIDFDEQEIFDWALAHKADVNAAAAIDEEGFGGHTPLFNTVVSQAWLCGRQRDATMVRRLLAEGADPTIRVNLRKRILFTDDDELHTYHGVDPLAYAAGFSHRRWVAQAAVTAITEYLGR